MLKKVYYYIVGHIIAKLHYDKQYIIGRHFSSPGAPGWKWCVKDYFMCKKLGVNSGGGIGQYRLK